jgi:surface antigen
MIRSALFLALTLLSACGTMGGARNEGGTGSLLGGSDGEEASSAIMKSMRGGLIGGAIGAGLSDDEKSRALAAEYRALEYTQAGQVVGWKGDSDGLFGSVAAAQPYRVGSQDCRQYTQTVNRSGQSKIARGTACRNADGSWTPLS